MNRRRNGPPRWRLLVAAAGLLAMLATPVSARSLRFVGGQLALPDGKAGTVVVDVAEGRIAAITDAAAAPAPPHDAEVVDLGGAFLLPGLIDAHGHLAGLGFAMQQADLTGADSKAEVVRRLQAHARSLPEDAWLLGRGWDQNRWPEADFPTAADLDVAFPERPLFLTRVDGHAGWANSAALRRLPAETRDRLADPAFEVEGGRILRADGVATGVFIDAAMALVRSAIPPPDEALTRHALRLALAEAVRRGLTGVHDMGTSAAQMAILRELADAGELPLRVTAYADGDGIALAGLCAFGPHRHPSGRLRMHGVKLYADGALGSRGAALLADYADDPGNRGLLLQPAEKLRAILERARRCGLQVATHAIGDRANRMVLDLYREVLGDEAMARRWRIEHAQVVHVADLPRFASGHVLASMQPTHATSDMPWAPARLGPDRLGGAYAWRSLRRAGAQVPFGSDFPVESVNPLLGLYAALTRQDLAGQPEGGWLPSERLSFAEALDGYTRAAAHAGLAEQEVGALEVGMRADFLVLAENPSRLAPERLASLTVRATYVDGERVYPPAGASR